ncbi:MAG TPA: protein kinase [Gemmataceae bacterium]|nr:protein kinase [Gemmataceae bacterium]
MSDETLISDLLAQAEARLDVGVEPALETLCAGCPHVLAEVRERFEKLRAIRSFTDPSPPASPTPPIHDLAARHGYRVVREVGGGAMGVVYEARDRHGRTVALKTLNRPDPARLAYLKQEFEALAGLRHENLVAVYGQVSDGATWFYVMDFVPGRQFLDHVRGHGDAALRPALLQLARGIQALHRAGKLHRDIKPSNVLVAPDGRVKLLDYGLVAELDDSQAYAQCGLAGTVGYMSPEQCGTRPLTPASDWYSFGVLLYEALTGRLPFEGPFLEVLQRKQYEEPAPPTAVAAEAPADLSELCAELLRIDPTPRPTGEDVLLRLGAADPPPDPHADEILLGRDRHLAALRAAAARVRQTGLPVVVELHGPSGVGKSSLARRFLREAQADGAIVFGGQCYEQSAVPYKAFDSLIGALCRYLRKLPREKAEALLPVHLGDLARLFPVFGRLESVASAPPARTDDPHEVRRRAYQALRELLCRMAQRAPLVVFVDDLHWGDAESAALGAAIVHPPDAPPLLFLAGYRRGDGGASPFVRALWAANVERRDVPIDPLTPDEARDLAGALLGPEFADQAVVIAREADGSPLLIHELVRFFRTGAAADRLTLGTVLAARAARLGDDPRRLLEVVALAAGPIHSDTAVRAADLAPERQPGAWDELLTGKFVRSVATGEGRRVEPYHDRFREAVANGLSEAQRANYHRRLAAAHEAIADAGPEVVAYHFTRGGESTRAAPFHAAAADRAAAALAFDRAADHYREALAGLSPDDPRHREWLLALAGVLAGAGRGREAAATFSAAADLSTGTDALFCRQRAAEQLTRSGRFDEGMAALVAVLRGAGIDMPKTPTGLWWSVRWLRLASWLRGLRFRERPATDASPEDRLRVEVFRWAAGVVRMVDLLRGTWFHYRGLRLALRVGEPYALAQALARETTIGLPFGGQTPERIEHLSRLASDVAGRVEDPAQRAEAEAVVEMYRAIAHYLVGDFRHALTEAESASEALGRCKGVSAAYQRATVRMFETSALLYLGQLDRCRERFESEYRRQLDRGNLPGVVVLPLAAAAHRLELAADRPAAARQMIDGAIRRWDQQGFHLLRLYAWWSEIDVLLYEGRTEEAWAYAEKWWPMANRRSLLTIDMAILLANSARARAAVARAADLGRAASADLLREAERRARRMERLHGLPVAAPHGWLIRAAVAHLRGKSADAIRQLERADAAFAGAGMALHAAAARRRLGQLNSGPDGQKRLAAADADMTTLGVHNPERFASLYAPGFGPVHQLP